MSLIRPTLSELIDRIRADFETRLPGADSRLRHSFLDVLARAHAGSAAGLYGFIDFVAQQILPDTATGEYLARHASIWGVARKGAVGASGAVTFTGINGASIPAATELVRIDGAVFRTNAPAMIAAGVAIVPVEAVAGGPGGDTAVATNLTLTGTILGVNGNASVTTAIAGGADEESDALLLDRLLLRIRNPAQGGAKTDYLRWTLEVAEVTRAWVYPNWTGPGTVGITFVLDGREDILPDEDDLDAVEAYLEPLRPVTAELVLFAATARPVDITIELAPATDAVKAAVVAELVDLFSRDAEPGGTIRISRIREAISLAQGEAYHDLVLPLEDVVTAAGQMPMLGDVVWA